MPTTSTKCELCSISWWFNIIMHYLSGAVALHRLNFYPSECLHGRHHQQCLHSLQHLNLHCRQGQRQHHLHCLCLARKVHVCFWMARVNAQRAFLGMGLCAWHAPKEQLPSAEPRLQLSVISHSGMPRSRSSLPTLVLHKSCHLL